MDIPLPQIVDLIQWEQEKRKKEREREKKSMTIDPAQIIHSISVIFSGHLSSIPIKLWLDKQQILQNRKSRFEKKNQKKPTYFFLGGYFH